MKVIRKLYDWVLSWAETPYGAPALFLLALVESSIFPIPPDVLLIALCISLPTRAWRFALLASIGSVLGGLLGYSIGWGAWPLVNDFFFHYIPGFTPAVFEKVQNLFAEYGFWVVFTAGFTPIPYKVITIGSGGFSDQPAGVPGRLAGEPQSAVFPGCLATAPLRPGYERIY